MSYTEEGVAAEKEMTVNMREGRGKNKKSKLAGGLLTAAMMIAMLAGCGEDVQETTGVETILEETLAGENISLMGQITAIEGDTITIALTEQPQTPNTLHIENGVTLQTPGEPPEESAEPQEKKPPEGVNGSQEKALPEEGDRPQKEVLPGDSDKQEYAELFRLTGEEKQITVTDATLYTINGQEGTFADLQIEDMVTVLMQGDEVISVMTGMGMNREPGDPSADGSSSVSTQGAYAVTGTQSWVGSAYDTSDEDMSVIRISDGGTLGMTNSSVTKSGDSSDTESSSLYGLNAGVLVCGNGSLNISDSTVYTDAKGSEALYASGKGAQIQADNVKMAAVGEASGGLGASCGGTIAASYIEINTNNGSSPAVSSRTGGNISISDSKLLTEGKESPCLYAGGSIFLKNTEGSASGSIMAAVVKGGSVTLEKSGLTGSGTGSLGGQDYDAGILLCQQTPRQTTQDKTTQEQASPDMSGKEMPLFTAIDSTLTINEESSGYEEAPMFLVTNTAAEIYLANSQLQYGSGILLRAAEEEGEAAGSIGVVTLRAVNQILEGSIEADSGSKVHLNLSASDIWGMLNAENAAESMEITMDVSSIWEVTGDSYVTVLNNAETGCGNIHSNGYNVYYKEEETGNAWLNGRTITLPGGGKLMPV